ncbi:MAG TPA: FKBP-type peptidyl-prolyl cis-trans isomerase, partial [Dyella sp.]|uniref:FKBP-type peptidyl-prolyl cis-trans isomerase n=1 Tax=Dyella sp. TaxID=1869338 RepID=UPI002BEC9458
MKAGKDKVIAFHYTLSVDGEKVESSHDGGEPLWILLGYGQLIPGLEKALEDHGAGDTLQVEIPPADGYGERQEGQIQRVPKKYFHQG